MRRYALVISCKSRRLNNSFLGSILALLRPFHHHDRYGISHLQYTQTQHRCARPLREGHACPFTYSNYWHLLSDLEKTAPRIRSDFKPKDDEIIQNQKRRQKRRERKVKRMVAAGIGYLVITWMVYLIMITATTTKRPWDPYEILGVSRVRNRSIFHNQQ